MNTPKLKMDQYGYHLPDLRGEENRRKYRQQLHARAKRLQAEWDRKRQPSYMAPGVYTQTFTGHPDYVGSYVNQHHAAMNATYWNYVVLSTTAAAMPDAVCIYVTYQIGLPRQAAMPAPYGQIR